MANISLYRTFRVEHCTGGGGGGGAACHTSLCSPAMRAGVYASVGMEADMRQRIYPLPWNDSALPLRYPHLLPAVALCG